MSGISERSLREMLATVRHNYEATLARAVHDEDDAPGDNVDLDELREATLDAALAVVDATEPGEFWILEFQGYWIKSNGRHKFGGPMAAVFSSRENALARMEAIEENELSAGGVVSWPMEHDFRIYRTAGYGLAAEAEEYGTVPKEGTL